MKLYGTRGGSGTALLARAVYLAYGLAPLPPVERTETGKPFFPQHPKLFFNLSHSGPLVLCALSARPVGVDIEVIKPRRAALPRQALTEDEYRRYLALGEDWPAFYTLWTRKEAWCKYSGLGLAEQWGKTPPDHEHYRSYAGDGWRAAVWGEEAPPEHITWLKGEDTLEAVP